MQDRAATQSSQPPINPVADIRSVSHSGWNRILAASSLERGVAVNQILEQILSGPGLKGLGYEPVKSRLRSLLSTSPDGFEGIVTKQIDRWISGGAKMSEGGLGSEAIVLRLSQLLKFGGENIEPIMLDLYRRRPVHEIEQKKNLGNALANHDSPSFFQLVLKQLENSSSLTQGDLNLANWLNCYPNRLTELSTVSFLTQLIADKDRPFSQRISILSALAKQTPERNESVAEFLRKFDSRADSTVTLGQFAESFVQTQGASEAARVVALSIRLASRAAMALAEDTKTIIRNLNLNGFENKSEIGKAVGEVARLAPSGLALLSPQAMKTYLQEMIVGSLGSPSSEGEKVFSHFMWTHRGNERASTLALLLDLNNLTARKLLSHFNGISSELIVTLGKELSSYASQLMANAKATGDEFLHRALLQPALSLQFYGECLAASQTERYSLADPFRFSQQQLRAVIGMRRHLLEEKANRIGLPFVQSEVELGLWLSLPKPAGPYNLVLMGAADHNFAFFERYESSLIDIPRAIGRSVNYQTATNRQEWAERLFEGLTLRPEGPKTIVLGGHGDGMTFALGDSTEVGVSDEQWLRENHPALIARAKEFRGDILLENCSSGALHLPLAEQVGSSVENRSKSADQSDVVGMLRRMFPNARKIVGTTIPAATKTQQYSDDEDDIQFTDVDDPDRPEKEFKVIGENRQDSSLFPGRRERWIERIPLPHRRRTSA